ncbi:hypothetical protein [Ammoniphilus sp. YIM 78166]|uniref:hypothetical protein n=1 Tax=Ammoniphilus sp. YIM 78166 TaxID=1644106 RepID=UPI00106F8F80|nr:hypothetical protein [Ammoniphilus sp. YIM 78166]
MATSGRKALIKMSGAAVSATGLATTKQADNRTYFITDTTKRVLDPNAAVTVKVAGVVTAEAYVVDRLTGKIVFNVANAGRGAVTVDVAYLPLTTVGEAKEYSWIIEADNQETTGFQDAWVKRKQALKDTSASLGRWYVDPVFRNKLEAGEPVVLEFYVDAALAPDLKMWAVCSSDEISGSADGLIEESIDFEGTTDKDGRAVSV